MQEVFLHLGLQKTATTFFQLEVFPYLEGITYYNKPKLSEVLNKTVHGDRVLISEEGWSHTFTDKGKLPPPSQIDYEFNILNKLQTRFPNASIIIGMRDVESWVKSLFSRFYKETNDMDFEKFKNEINPYFLKQERYVNSIQNMFPRTFIYYYEDFLNNKQDIVYRMCCKFMGANITRDIEYDRKHNESLFRWEGNKCFLKKPGRVMIE